MKLKKFMAVSALAAVAASVIPTAALADGQYDGSLVTDWTTKTIVLNADGKTVDTDTVSFVGTPVSVPGDRALRTVKVTNNGPTAGVLKVYITDATVKASTDANPQSINEAAQSGSTSADGTASDPFYGHLNVGWVVGDNSGSKTIAELAKTTDKQEIGDVILAKGESTNVTINYDIPSSTRAGNSVSAGDQEAAFNVVLTISGDGEEGSGGSSGQAGQSGSTAPTGFEVAAIALGAAALTGAGALGVAATRRKKSE